MIYVLHISHASFFFFTLSAPIFFFGGGVVHIYDKVWTAFIFSCRPPHPGWRHLRWSPRSLCHTCSSPGCCTCRCPTCSRRWRRSWRTCQTRTWGWCARPSWSPCRSSARWPPAWGHPRCCTWDWEPGVTKENPLSKKGVVAAENGGEPSYLPLLYGDHVRQTPCHTGATCK